MVLSNQRDTCSPRGTLTTPNLPSQCDSERQSSRKQLRRRFWCPLWSTTRLPGVDSSIIRSYNLKTTLPSSSIVLLLWSFFPKASYSTERSALLSTYNNLFMHVPWYFQESDGMKDCPFHIDPPGLWLWPVGDVVLALRLHLAGTIHTITPLVILRATRIHHDVATATNGHLALGAAEKHQIKGRQENLEVDAPTLHPLQVVPTS